LPIRPTPGDAVERITGVLREVISEKTGYPEEMLELEMALDADLGIDSIKRVEILSALQERLPQAPPIKPEHLGTLHNLRQIAAFLAGAGPGEGRGTDWQSVPSQPDRLAIRPTAHASPSPALERTVLRAVQLGADRPLSRLPTGAEIWLTEEDTGLARALGERLSRLGYQPRVLSLEGLLAQEQAALLGGLVVLAPRQAVDDAWLRNALFVVQRAAGALRRAGQAGGSLLLTVSRLDGAFGLARIDPEREPLDGALAGLAKTANHEWPEVQCRAIDLSPAFPSADEAADALLDEMFPPTA
jgi:acyl carrier protein